jgi:hypothetical protein
MKTDEPHSPQSNDMDFIFASEVSRTINASLTNGGVSSPLHLLSLPSYRHCLTHNTMVAE